VACAAKKLLSRALLLWWESVFYLHLVFALVVRKNQMQKEGKVPL
jgi:hypothetical protein